MWGNPGGKCDELGEPQTYTFKHQWREQQQGFELEQLYFTVCIRY